MKDYVAILATMLLSISFASAYIDQISTTGNPGEMGFYTSMSGGEYECGVIAATGTLENFAVNFIFDGNGDAEAWPADMFLLIQNDVPYGLPGHVCYQYGGYDYTVQGCTIVGDGWPSDWDNDSEQEVSGTGDMTAAGITLTAGQTWLTCIGNGWRECGTAVVYTGEVTLTGTTTTEDPGESAEPTPHPTNDGGVSSEPTVAPTLAPTLHAPTLKPTEGGTAFPTSETVVIEERCNTEAIAEFDVYLVGGADTRGDFPASGNLTTISVSMYFGGATYNSAEWASDMLLFVKQLDGSNCVVMGGFDYNTPGCDFVGYWPTDWETSEAGIYTHDMDVTSYGIFGNSSYTVGIANGYAYGENAVYYQGNVTLNSLVYDCFIPDENFMIQNSGEGESAKMKFDGRLGARETVCGPLLTDDGFDLKNIVMNPLEFDAQGYAGSWAADMFVTVTSVGGSTETECVQYGGFDYVVPGCTLYGHWPSEGDNSWDETDKGGGTSSTPGDYDNVEEAYNGEPGGGDVSEAHLSNTNWEICVGNGWRESGGVAAYAGDMELQGLITANRPPTAAPTLAPSGTRSTPTANPTQEPTAPQNLSPTAPPSGDIINLEVVSGYDDTAKISFDAFEKGGQNDTLSFNASGTLTTIEINFNFAGAPPDSGEWASDMLLVIYGPDGNGIQIGGFDDNIPNCVFEGYWPSDWETGAPGLYTHTETIDEAVITGDGMYTAEIINGYLYGTQYVGYQGDFTLNGLLDKTQGDVPEPDIGIPTAQPTGAAGGGSDDTPVEETAAFIVPITLLVIGIVSGVAFYFYYTSAVASGKWKPWSGSSSSWRTKDVKPALTTSILDTPGSGGGGVSAYTPPTAPGTMVANPMARNRGGPMSKDERL